HALERPVEAIIPSVIRTMQDRGDPARFGYDFGSVVTADIEEGTHLTVGATYGNDRFASDGGGHELSRLLDLIGSTQNLPGVAEDGEGPEFGGARVHIPRRGDGRGFREWSFVVVACQNRFDRLVSNHLGRPLAFTLQWLGAGYPETGGCAPLSSRPLHPGVERVQDRVLR